MAQPTGMHFDANYKKLELAIKRLPQFVEVSTRMYTKRSAIQFTKFLQDQIRGNKLGLAKLKIRKGGTPLDDTGELVDALGYRHYKKAGGGVYYVGAVSGKVHKRSGLLVSKLMRIHEYGTTIKVTDRMRNFLHTIDIHLKKDTKYVRIPPRPAMRLSWAKFVKNTTLRGQRNRELEKVVKQFMKTAQVRGAEIRDARAKEY